MLGYIIEGTLVTLIFGPIGLVVYVILAILLYTPKRQEK